MADSFSEKIHRTLSFDPAPVRDVLSLQNWVDDTSCLSRDETAYLENERELISLVPSGDNTIKKLEDWIEDQLIRYYKGFQAV